MYVVQCTAKLLKYLNDKTNIMNKPMAVCVCIFPFILFSFRLCPLVRNTIIKHTTRNIAVMKWLKCMKQIFNNNDKNSQRYNRNETNKNFTKENERPQT